MRILDLLERAELGLSIVWAEPAALEREVTGSTRLAQPATAAPAAGHLVLAAHPPPAAALASRLVESRVAALVVAAPVGDAAPLVSACRAAGLPVLLLAPHVTPDTLERHIAASRDLIAHVLRDDIGSGGGAQRALDAFRASSGVDGWVLESGGTVNAVAGPAPGLERVARVWNRMLGSPDTDTRGSPGTAAAVVVDPRGTLSVWPIVTDSVQTIGYLVFEADHRAWPPELERVARTLVLVVRVELELRDNARQAEHAAATDLVRSLIADSLSPGELSARLRRLGVDPAAPITAVVAQVDDPGYPSRAVLDAVTSLLAADGRAIVGCDLGDEAVVLLGGAHTAPAAGLDPAPAATEQRALLGDRHLRIGVSASTASPGQLAAAVASARARVRSAVGEGAITWSTRSAPLGYRALLDFVPDRIRAEFGRGLLAPLVDYDVRHGSELVLTLRVFLDASGAWQQAATELHVHVNTLRYRVGRIEDLTSRDLSTMRDRVDFFLALASVDPR